MRDNLRMSPDTARSSRRPSEPHAIDVRAADLQDVDRLAQIWYDSWQDAHAAILPVELRRFRTRGSFRDRLQQALPHVRVVGPFGAPVGLCITRRDELYQLYVSAGSRGSGVAAALVADSEARIAEAGIATAWLACAIGNDRAARFYEKCGWRRVGTMVNHAETSEGSFPLEVWRYEKSLAAPRSAEAPQRSCSASATMMPSGPRM
jgi:ribosomal protein S18 acetylase RimI-like enzyme